MFRKVVIALARHGVNLSGCPARTCTQRHRRAPGHIDSSQALGAANGMGRYGGDQCQKRVQELEEELEQCQAAIVTCGPTAGPTAKPTGAPGECVVDQRLPATLAGKPCLSVWTSDDTGCDVDQYGCEDSACDGDESPWCMIADDGNPNTDDWCYCKVKPTAEPTRLNKCVDPDEDNNPDGKYAGDRCQAVWTTEDTAACKVDQYGCPSTACDGDDKPWCMIEDSSNWCYCE